MIHSWIEQIAAVPFFSTPAFGIIAMVIVGGSWCLTGFVMGDAPKRGIEPSLVQMFSAICAFLISLVIMFVTGSVPHCPLRSLLLTCGLIGLGGFFNFFVLLLMSFAMQRGPNGVIWSIIQSSLIFPFITGILFFDVKLSWVRGGGLFFLLLALAFFAMTKDNSMKKGSWKIPAFLCFLLCGLPQNLNSLPSYFQEAKEVNSIARTLALSVGTLLAAVIYNLIRMTPEYKTMIFQNIKRPALWTYVVCMKFFSLFFAYTLTYPGMDAMAEAGLGAMCYPMMIGSCIITFTLTAIFLLKEKFTLHQAFALLACISGLVMICWPVRG